VGVVVVWGLAMNDVASPHMTKTLADTIIWLAEERVKDGKVQNLNSAIIAIGLEADQILMERMAKEKNK